MKAVLIDAENKTIAPIDTDGELKSLYALCKCETIDIINVAKGVCMVIDDEGAINGTRHGFDYKGYGELAGNAVIIGSNDETGAFRDLNVPAEAFSSLVTFRDYGEGGMGAKTPEVIAFDDPKQFWAFMSSLRRNSEEAMEERGRDIIEASADGTRKGTR